MTAQMKALTMGTMQVLPCYRAPSAHGVLFELLKLWRTMLQGHLKMQATLPQKGCPLGQVRFYILTCRGHLTPLGEWLLYGSLLFTWR